MLDRGLVRYRNGRFQQFSSSSGAPDRGVRALLVDRQGRLWIGSRYQGLLRIDDPSAAYPVFFAYTKLNGLSDNTVAALVEDLGGRIYAAGGSGIDRLDPATGRVRCFTAADGLLPGVLRVAFRDRHGALWFGGDQGLFRLEPREERTEPPVVLIYSIRVNGKNAPVSDVGEVEPAALSLSPTERQVQVDFGGFRHDLLYQTRLSGVDRDWTAPSSSRGVHYLSLAPGIYELAIRAVNSEGSLSSHPARVRFRVATPVWERWWFRWSALLVVATIAYLAYRIRVGRLLEMERLQMRIATDLHDDIGASLSQIAILSEVAREGGGEPLARIAGISRELVDSMSDIVWAVSPHRDRLTDLVQRMRQFAEDVLVTRGMRFELRVTDPQPNRRLNPEVRREVFLIFKECIHNVRHSGCGHVESELRTDADWLELSLRDDGHGLDAAAKPGHGLASMRRRARDLGGDLELTSRPGEGVTTLLRVPLSRRAWRRADLSGN
jgi:two-component sensor histidine kinase